ncbi:sigma-70 family RNA polymerase sigma factor [Demequina sp. SYSU T00068]|uniref:RNA polymerase sigma factor n=1 Tax=Demequina lignilytica TaxID=3051663 RepID=UPI002621A496|nr:sigma-70 family RNA polymerase sigma factor [Demequina sp. SYSU T00068]MDN4491672.1 sigma-70 family RNA polymerase sigma factor [Demequina sp. SYSU T00068]
MSEPPVGRALTAVAREEGGRLLALLADRLGGIELAEDALQDAYARAATSWDRDGVPANPPAWVYTVARNAGIDRLRREKAAGRRVARQARVLDAGVVDPRAGVAAPDAPEDGEARIAELAEVGDERLRLLLLCCHPALGRDAQVALTLRLAGGLTTAEIAASFLVPEATIAQRLVRAKRKIRAANIPLTIPADLSERAAVLTAVLGLIFNEGYVAHTAVAGTLTRAALADQAIMLTAIAADALPDEPELGGLLALELFHRSREAARVDATGRLVVLAEQDRTLWDRMLVARGYAVLAQAMSARRLGPWQVKALIAAEHTRPRTDWARIVRYHDMLLAMEPGPVAALSRAVALSERDGPEVGLDVVEAVEGLDGYHLLHATRGHLLERLGRGAEAAAAWRRAAALAGNPTEAAHAAERAASAERGRRPEAGPSPP